MHGARIEGNRYCSGQRTVNPTAADLDAADPLADWRGRFALPQGQIYLAGNSLGPLPEGVAERVQRALHEEWGAQAVRAWNRAGWIDAPARIGERLAPLLGAQPAEVLVCDGTSLNLFKLLGAALRLSPERRRVLAERDAFPSDTYITASAVRWLAPERELQFVAREQMGAALQDDVAVAVLQHVDYRSGQLSDMGSLCARARERGVLTLWDLAHSAGAMPLQLGEAGADLAVGCGYKYLCGGPGAPAFVYVAERLHGDIEQPLQGWLGHREPFAFEEHYRAAPGVARMLCGTPPILSMLALESAVQLLAGADLAALRRKSEALGDWFIACVDEECAGLGVELASPRAAEQRGSQVTLRHPEAYAVMQALIARGVVGDFRAPDLMRFGLAALYVSFADAQRAARALREVLETRAQRDPRFQQRARVT